MSTQTKKHYGGSSCAVATCKNYSSKIKDQGLDISFHRFPKNPEICNKWVHKCRRGDKWNPKTSVICSEHFTQDSFVRDLKAELLGYTPKVRMLKPDVVPTLHLPPDHSHNVTSTAAINRNKRNENKFRKQIHNQLILSSIASTSSDSPSVEISSTMNIDSIPFPEKSSLNIDYEQSYNDLLKKHNELKAENYEQKLKISLLEEPLENYKKINESLQTNMDILQKNLNSTNSVLKTTQKKMSEEIKILSLYKKTFIGNQGKKLLSSVFSYNQLNLILKNKKRMRWTRDELAKAFTLRYLSKRSYIYVKNELHYPLPGLLSLQRWAKTIKMRNGILDDVLKIMKLNGDTLKDCDKLTVLMFDEMKVSSTIEYDTLNDEFIGPYNQMQIVMARGISSQWKQPIFIDFDKKMTKDILFDIIEKLDEIGFKVICCVSDCGGGNIGLWKALDINYQNPVFCIPNGRRIVYIPDAPYILSLVRNWLLDTGFYINEKIINKKPLEALVFHSAIDANCTRCHRHKLTNEHLSCEGPQWKKVKLATQLLSHNTVTALLKHKLFNNTKLSNDTGYFIELISNWFDLANVCHPNDKRTPYTVPYGLCFEDQNSLLNKVYETILNMRCIGNQNLKLFQKALLMNINGTKLLLKMLTENNLKYLLTSKINQNALENLFFQLRSRGGLNNHPSPLNALDRLRMMILGGIVTCSSNTTNQNQEEFLVATTFKQAGINVKGEFQILENQQNITIDSETDTSSDNESQFKESRNNSEMTNDAVEYLAGWVAKKHKSTFPEISSTTTVTKSRALNDHDYLIPSWISQLSYGGLITPSRSFKTNIFRVEKLFQKNTKKLLPKGSRVVKRLTEKIFNRTKIAQKYKPVILSYIKQRLLIRMKYFNLHAASLAKKRKAKAQLRRLNKLKNKLMTC